MWRKIKSNETTYYNNFHSTYNPSDSHSINKDNIILHNFFQLLAKLAILTQYVKDYDTVYELVIRERIR